MENIHTMEYYLTLIMKEILSYVKTWMHLEDIILSQSQKSKYRYFPGGAMVKNPPATAGDTRSSPGLGRSHL